MGMPQYKSIVRFTETEPFRYSDTRTFTVPVDAVELNGRNLVVRGAPIGVPTNNGDHVFAPGSVGDQRNVRLEIAGCYPF